MGYLGSEESKKRKTSPRGEKGNPSHEGERRKAPIEVTPRCGSIFSRRNRDAPLSEGAQAMPEGIERKAGKAATQEAGYHGCLSRGIRIKRVKPERGISAPEKSPPCR